MTFWLEQLGAKVFGYSLEPATQPSLYERLGRPAAAASVLADVCDSVALQNAMAQARPDVVIHMAAQALVHDAYADPTTTFATNVMGCVHLLEAVRRTPSVRVVLNVTSDKCYENHEQLWGYRETDCMGGSDPYSASKGCAELVTASWRRSFFASGQAAIASARAGNVIGGGDWSAHRLIPDCIRAFAEGRPVLIRNPAALRPWQHVLEPLCGYLLLVEAVWAEPEDFAEGWNFGPDHVDAQPVVRVVQHLARAWGDGAGWEQDAVGWSKEAAVLRLDATKAHLRLGWRGRLVLDQALQWTAEWYKHGSNSADAQGITLEQLNRYLALSRQGAEAGAAPLGEAH